ncbi:MAG: hypothetical protein ACI90V_006211 [Bacillariaceae sp.]|jgi:hypothetical protein
MRALHDTKSPRHSDALKKTPNQHTHLFLVVFTLLVKTIDFLALHIVLLSTVCMYIFLCLPEDDK